MSALGFMTRDTYLAVDGRERHRLGSLLEQLAWRCVERDCDPREDVSAVAGSILRTAVSLPDWVSNAGAPGGHGQFCDMLRLYLAAAHDDTDVVYLPDTGRTPAATVVDVHVNSVIAAYPDPIAFAVRLRAQCEVNAWIDGPDRAWAADMIQAGLDTSWPAEIADVGQHTILTDRPRAGYQPWAAVCEMLRADDKQPVVLESSITEGFPSPQWVRAGVQDLDRPHTWWRTADAGQRWDASMTGLREETSTRVPMLRIGPDNLHLPHFGLTRTGVTWAALAAAWRPDPAT